MIVFSLEMIALQSSTTYPIYFPVSGGSKYIGISLLRCLLFSAIKCFIPRRCPTVLRVYKYLTVVMLGPSIQSPSSTINNDISYKNTFCRHSVGGKWYQAIALTFQLRGANNFSLICQSEGQC